MCYRLARLNRVGKAEYDVCQCLAGINELARHDSMCVSVSPALNDVSKAEYSVRRCYASIKQSWQGRIRCMFQCLAGINGFA